MYRYGPDVTDTQILGSASPLFDTTLPETVIFELVTLPEEGSVTLTLLGDITS